MELLNQTGAPSFLFRTILDDTRMAASVLVRATFDIVNRESLLAEEQPWITSPSPWDSPCGPMDGDEVFFRGGVDLLLFGSASAPEGRKVAKMPVRMAVGDFQRQILIFGDRFWRRSVRGLVASTPEPFERIPLTLAHAFGGTDRWDGLTVPFPYNPDGRGYYLEEANAVDRPLPNIEDPFHPISRWDERPEPVGVGLRPSFGGMRIQRGIRVGPTGGVEALLPVFFNEACPGMIAPAVEPGEQVRIDGVSARPLLFRLPDAQPLVRLRFGTTMIERPLKIDQIGVVADKRQLFVSYRYPFRYVVHSLQERRCELSWGVQPRRVGGLPRSKS